MAANYTKIEIKQWLDVCLKKENLKHLMVDNFKVLEKGEGCIGDIIFVSATARDKNETEKKYNLVLKCSKNNKILREVSPMKIFFINEIYFYEIVYPTFTKFQLGHGIDNPFSSVPKYYGSFLGDDREIVAFEDLTAEGFSTCEKKKPMSRNHIDLVVEEYARFHAISLAMKDQKSEEFEELTEPLNTLVRRFKSAGNNMILQFCSNIQDVYELLREDLDREVLLKWKNFGKYMEKNFMKMWINYEGFKVINHGDSWNNNFMFQIKDNDLTRPTKVSIIDWQIMKLNTPVSDLSHFLFACISKDDIEDLDEILEKYHMSLSNHLLRLHSDTSIYSRERFLEEWTKYSKIGIMMIPTAMKICILEKEEAIDIAEAANSGDLSNVFSVEFKNKTLLKERMKHVVKYVAEHGLI